MNAVDAAVCLVTERMDHPVLGAAMELIARRHATRVLDASSLSAQAAAAELGSPAGVYLLKSRSAAALELGHRLESAGAIVVNSPAATEACLDRESMAGLMVAAGLPFPQTTTCDDLARLPESLDGRLRFPMLVKSARSRRGDLVTRVDRREDLASLATAWGAEPVVLQEFVAGDGWDTKIWMIGDALHAARRRSPLETGATGSAKQNLPLPREELPADLESIGREVGRCFGLLLYGVDILHTDRGPVVVDVNAFPGFRGVPEAPSLLAELVESLSATVEVSA